MIQSHVDLLSEKMHAVPTRSTATAADDAGPLQLGFGVLVVGRASDEALAHALDELEGVQLLARELERVGKAGTGSQTRLANDHRSVISNTLRAYISGRQGEWDSHLTRAEFAINSTASMLGEGVEPLFVDRGAHPRIPLSPPHRDLAAGASTAHYTRRMRVMEAPVRELLAAAQADLMVNRYSSWMTACCCGPRNCSTLPIFTLALQCRLHPRAAESHALQPYRQRPIVDRLKPFFGRVARQGPAGPGTRLRTGTGRRTRGGAVAQPPPGARSLALPGALAGPPVRRRRVAAREGAASLPRQGGVVRCRGPRSPLPVPGDGEPRHRSPSVDAPQLPPVPPPRRAAQRA